jgi:hypothetical protein
MTLDSLGNAVIIISFAVDGIFFSTFILIIISVFLMKSYRSILIVNAFFVTALKHYTGFSLAYDS